MQSNYTITCNTPITEYEVSSKGIRLIRTIIPGGKSKDEPKPKKDDEKRKKSD